VEKLFEILNVKRLERRRLNFNFKTLFNLEFLSGSNQLFLLSRRLFLLLFLLLLLNSIVLDLYVNLFMTGSRNHFSLVNSFHILKFFE